GQATKVELKVGMPGLDKLEIAWAEDRATQGCYLSADPSADRSGAVLTVAPGWPCWPESDKSQGFGGRAPIWKKGHLPFEKTLTNGGESRSARVPLDPLFATVNYPKTTCARISDWARPPRWIWSRSGGR